MNKYFYISLLCVALFNPNKCNAQEANRSNIWPIGFSPVVVFKFTNQLNSIDTLKNKFSLTPPNCLLRHSASSICDTNGKLLFFGAGYTLFNKDGYLVKKSEYLNSPKGVKIANVNGLGSFTDHSEMILPKKNNQYYVISVGQSDSVYTDLYGGSPTFFKNRHDCLSYSVVDMDKDNGYGEVISKNNLMLDNQYYYNCANDATRHGNGRDWWWVKDDCAHNNFQTFLVTPDSIHKPFNNAMMPDSAEVCYRYGNIMFSEDGTKMLTSMTVKSCDSNLLDCQIGRIDIYDFDRCSGRLTYNNHYYVPDDSLAVTDSNGTAYYGDWKRSAAFSPNGKIAYVSKNFSIWQIDLEDTDKKNAIKVAGLDTTWYYHSWYNRMKLGPDGKLYIGNFHGALPYMRTIDNPNIRGLGCNFNPLSIYQLYTNLLSPPHMPNYGLGALINSLCDTIKANSSPFTAWDIYPNPTQDKLYITVPTADKEFGLKIISLYGQNVIDNKVKVDSKYKAVIDLSSYQAGMYIVLIQTGEEIIMRKVVKL